uniref:Uncharacterized protein n=1 Tax=Loigolactobacillus rennini TaxID=238013 RepID=A0A1K2I8B1_9LACO|nr:hypothetical protein LREN565_1600 [Loigolactobacillus rennini]
MIIALTQATKLVLIHDNGPDKMTPKTIATAPVVNNGTTSKGIADFQASPTLIFRHQRAT